jgi:NADH-quinone oxidoreductase subunit H
MPESTTEILAYRILELLPFLTALPEALHLPLAIALTGLVPITIISLIGLVGVYMERKISAFIQVRLGPMEVGPYGILQTLADGIKLIGKEDIIPRGADRPLFILAPIFAFVGVVLLFVAIPFDRNFIVVDLNVGIFYLAAVASIEVVGVIMAGWASNNKWSLLGAMREAAQVVAYEIPLGICLITVVLLAGSFSMVEIVEGQKGLFLNWFLFRNPVMWVPFIAFMVASLAELKRAPFDLPEAESELVSGFHTEYTGMRFSIFFIAEYGAMFISGALISVLFLGGYYTGIPFLDDIGGAIGLLLRTGTLFGKAFFFIFVQMWLRWTLPRVRLDQMFYICYKVLVPFGFVALLITAFWELVFPGQGFMSLGWAPGSQ